MQQHHDDTFHAGESLAQQKVGVRERMAELGPRVIRDSMPQQHRDFFALLPWLLIGSTDAKGQPWASVVTGKPGFIAAPDEQHLLIQAHARSSDPLRENLHIGASVGILGLQPHTRRRNRANGIVTQLNDGNLAVLVQQSFGNCPKYIQAREAKFLPNDAVQPEVEHLNHLDTAAIGLISAADTFFIATAHPASIDKKAWQLEAMEGIDVSHRGGKPGFIRVDGDSLLVPDYAGNFFFNTIGNLLLEPRAGLLFVDFSNSDLLQVAVRAEVIWDGPLLNEFAGAQRLLRLRVTELIRYRQALPLNWSKVEMSPYL